jgi:hypothetical protein
MALCVIFEVSNRKHCLKYAAKYENNIVKNSSRLNIILQAFVIRKIANISSYC